MLSHSLDPSLSTPQIPFTIDFIAVFPFSQALVFHFTFFGMIITFTSLGSPPELLLLNVVGVP